MRNTLQLRERQPTRHPSGLTAEIPAAGAERRRSRRIPLVMPMEVTWATPDGVRIKQHALTEEVSAHGAVLRMITCPPLSAELELSRPHNSSSTEARVVGRRNPGLDGLVRIAVETRWTWQDPPPRELEV